MTFPEIAVLTVANLVALLAVAWRAWDKGYEAGLRDGAAGKRES